MASPAAPSPILPAATGNSPLDAYTKASQNLVLGGGLDFSTSPTYQSLASLLGPGPNGGLNASLMGQYTAAQPLLAQQMSENVAQAKSNAQGRGLGGSSIEAQGVENAEFQGTMANASLLSSLYGQQNQDISQLAGYLFQGSGQMTSDLLGIYDSAGTSAANMSMYSQGLQEALQAAAIAGRSQQNAGIFQGAGAALGGIATGIGYGLSDVRLKTNVRRVGQVGDGTVGVYEFEYVPGRGLPEGRHVGFLAHEVRKTNPDAVVEKGGYLHVRDPFLPRKVG